MSFPLYYYSTVCLRCGSNDTYEDTAGFHCNNCKFNSIDIPNHWIPYTASTTKECVRCGDVIPANRNSMYCRNCRIEIYDRENNQYKITFGI